jgi:hypothetical protein
VFVVFNSLGCTHDGGEDAGSEDLGSLLVIHQGPEIPAVGQEVAHSHLADQAVEDTTPHNQNQLKGSQMGVDRSPGRDRLTGHNVKVAVHQGMMARLLDRDSGILHKKNLLGQGKLTVRDSSTFEEAAHWGTVDSLTAAE